MTAPTGSTTATDNGGQAGQQSSPAWTPPSSQQEFDRIIGDRLGRQAAKFEADNAETFAKARKHDELELELSDTATKAAAKATDEATSKVRGEYVPRLVRAEFRAEAKGVLTKEQLDELLEDLDLSKYVDKDGEADAARISKKVGAFAPAKSGQQRPPRDLGQGQHEQARPERGSAGAAMAEKRFGKKS